MVRSSVERYTYSRCAGCDRFHWNYQACEKPGEATEKPASKANADAGDENG